MDAVIKALRQALSADPDDVELRAHLAQVLLEEQRTGEALAESVIVLGSRPDHLPALRVAQAAARAEGDQARADAYGRLLRALGGAPDEVAPATASPPAPPAPGEPVFAVPDTIDEVVQGWSGTDAAAEPETGHLRAAGVTLADVGGLETVKQRLERSFLQPVRNPGLTAQFGKSLRGGLMLWGPPGCGKTFIARALAGELGAAFYEVGLTDVLDMYIGSSERNLRSVFDAARRNRPCLLFFDEIDALGQKRSQLRHSGAMRGVVNQLLAELDGAASDNEGVFVLAASNHPWDIDSALLRPGRFDRSVLVLPPDQPAREAILAYHLRGRPVEALDLAKVAKATEGYSGADLALVCEQATESAMTASVAAGTVRPITQRGLQDAARSVRPSVGDWLETARNYALFGNTDGEYDELAAYLKQRRRR
ncbi:AAA family ATPase [Luteipulveratus sp. YIM 133132]|uniref:AAA family ATPase n=1 Tax=Luteipulveratus flavus TaxID=3031728 RepID=UPI0023B0277D|nr:AAA family ATPase [Luteipulveratus sp. YIM 133132]MDE9365205.1 AAA family ATPase [Luteipulveratus sp. YIM 133132]